VNRREDTQPGLRPVEDDAPGKSHHGTPSELIRDTTSKFATVAADQLVEKFADALPALGREFHDAAKALRERGSAWPLAAAVVGVVALLVAGFVTWGVLTHTDECSPLVVEHVLHQAQAGEDAAAKLEASGDHGVAKAIRDITSADAQPDNVRLCVLIERKKK